MIQDQEHVPNPQEVACNSSHIHFLRETIQISQNLNVSLYSKLFPHLKSVSQEISNNISKVMQDHCYFETIRGTTM